MRKLERSTAGRGNNACNGADTLNSVEYFSRYNDFSAVGAQRVRGKKVKTLLNRLTFKIYISHQRDRLNFIS